MTIYRILSTLPVAAGTIVQLDDAQAANRAHRIEPLGEGRYRLKELLQFKRGEVVGIEGDLPRVHLECVQLDDAPISESGPASDQRTPAGNYKKKPERVRS